MRSLSPFNHRSSVLPSQHDTASTELSGTRARRPRQRQMESTSRWRKLASFRDSGPYPFSAQRVAMRQAGYFKSRCVLGPVTACTSAQRLEGRRAFSSPFPTLKDATRNKCSPKSVPIMHGTIDHKAARGHSPIGAAQSTRDPYARTQLSLFRERSRSPKRDWDEVDFGERRPQRGRSSARAMVMAGMRHALERQYLDQKRETLGVRHPDTISFMVQLAAKWFEQGRLKEVEPLAIQILEFRRELLGQKHPDTLSAMADMEELLEEQGRYNEAETLGKEVVLWRGESLGTDHPDTIMSIAKLAKAWTGLGRYYESEKALAEALEICKRSCGAKHKTTVEVMMELAEASAYLGRYKEAEILQCEVLEAKREICGPMSRSTVKAMFHLANTMSFLGQHEQAETLQLQVLELRKKLLGPKHPETIRTIGRLAVTAYHLGQYERAESLQIQALDLRKEVLGTRHPETIKAMGHLAATYRGLGRFDEAELLQIQVLDLHKETFGIRHPETMKARGSLATTQFHLGKFEEAESTRREMLDLRKEILGPRHPDTVLNMERLAKTLHAQARYDEAETLQTQVVDLRTEDLGLDHPDTIRALRCLTSWERAQQSPKVEEAGLGLKMVGTAVESPVQEVVVEQQVLEHPESDSTPGICTPISEHTDVQETSKFIEEKEPQERPSTRDMSNPGKKHSSPIRRTNRRPFIRRRSINTRLESPQSVNAHTSGTASTFSTTFALPTDFGQKRQTHSLSGQIPLPQMSPLTPNFQTRQTRSLARPRQPPSPSSASFPPSASFVISLTLASAGGRARLRVRFSHK